MIIFFKSLLGNLGNAEICLLFLMIKLDITWYDIDIYIGSTRLPKIGLFAYLFVCLGFMAYQPF